MRALLSFACGLLFGLGLWLSGMTNPLKVLGFLDVFGQWDPSLAFVLLAAVTVTALGYRVAFGRSQPLFGAVFDLPTSRSVDVRLVAGSAIFGVGWALGGFCPGPALTNLALGDLRAWAFVAAMVVGMAIAQAVGPSGRRDGGRVAAGRA